MKIEFDLDETFLNTVFKYAAEMYGDDVLQYKDDELFLELFEKELTRQTKEHIIDTAAYVQEDVFDKVMAVVKRGGIKV